MLTVAGVAKTMWVGICTTAVVVKRRFPVVMEADRGNSAVGGGVAAHEPGVGRTLWSAGLNKDVWCSESGSCIQIGVVSGGFSAHSLVMMQAGC